MIEVGVNLTINQELVDKISLEGKRLWAAAHDDGSHNRFDGEAVADAATISFGLSAIVAGIAGARKAYKNKDKSKEDLKAEQEARKINEVCDSLTVWLQTYIRSAQNGRIDEKSFDYLSDILQELHEYNKAGKMVIPGKEELAELRKSITEYTSAIAINKGYGPVKVSGPDDFYIIRDQLLRQKEILVL